MNTLIAPALPATGEPELTASSPDFYNVSQAATLLGVSRVTLSRWIQAGRLPAARLGHRTVRVTRDDLDQLLLQRGLAGSHAWVGRRRGAGAGAEDLLALGTEDGDRTPSAHTVQFYETDAFLLDAVTAFLAPGLRTGETSLVVATPAHRAGLEECLTAAGVDVVAARAAGQYAALDAAETLAQFMVAGMPDATRFAEVVGGVITQAGPDRPLRIFGEMVALLAADGKHTAALRLEQLWNALAQRLRFSLFCAYPLRDLDDAAGADLLGPVCAAHERVIPAESFTALRAVDDRLLAIVALQQKAERLEAEIAERRRAEEQLREARDAALRAVCVRDEFLGSISHDLRTPLTSIAGLSQLLLRQAARSPSVDSTRVTKALLQVDASASRMAAMIDELLDLTRLESGRPLDLRRTPADAVALVRPVVEQHQRGTGIHRLTVSTDLSELAVCWDSARIERVLSNLLSNAVKYSPDGGAIAVQLTAEQVDEQPWLRLVVEDQGLGIPAADLPHICERFHRARNVQGQITGIGIGLAGSKQIVEQHGGSLTVESREGCGTRVTVCLPCEPCVEADA